MLSHFKNEVRTVQVTRFSLGALVDGEFVPGTSTEPEPMEMVCIPITPAQLKTLPEGKYTSGDMRFYHTGAPVCSDGDIIAYDGVPYTVRDITDRTAIGNFTIYLAQRPVNDDQS
jgi:hypothetical protein